MIHPLKSRFYWLRLQQDLFGTWCVHKVSGGLSHKYGRESWLPYASKQDASKALSEVEYRHRQRGYIYSDIHHVEHFDLKPQLLAEL